MASINSLGYRTDHTIDEKLGVAIKSTDANGLLTIYTYDSFGNILSATSPLDTTIYTMWWSRDVTQAPINSEYYTKTVSTGKPTTTTFYDCLGREVRRVTESPDGKSILATITNYDNCGRVHEVSNPYFPKYQPILTTTEYDKAGRIESVTNVGNIEYKDGTNRLAMIEGYKIPEWESIKYTSFNKIKEVIATRNNGISDIRFVYMMAYGPDKTRCMQMLYPQGRPGNNYYCKYYVGNIYNEAHNNGKILKQDYIYANGNLVAIHQTKQGNEKMLYVHLDNIGSIWAYTDENGEITEELNYDPWGRKRNPETWDYYKGYKHLTSNTTLLQNSGNVDLNKK